MKSKQISFEAIDKDELIKALIANIESELSVATQAAKVAHEDATNEESKPENEYDTRALEASYIARGQAKRVAELKETLFEFRKMPIRSFVDSDLIMATALIEVECESKISTLFFMPKGGGFTITIGGRQIQIVTPSSPLGQALLQAKVGDLVLVELGKATKEYEILKIK